MKLPCLDISATRRWRIPSQHAAHDGYYLGYSSCSATQPEVVSP